MNKQSHSFGSLRLRLPALALVLTLMVPAPCAYGAGAKEKEPDPGSPAPGKVHFGLRAGFDSTLSLISDITSPNLKILDHENEYRVGYSASLFMRWDLSRRFFLQPEVSLDVTKGSTVVSVRDLDEPEEVTDFARSSYRATSLGLPLLAGFRLINAGDCSMSLVFGPKFRYVLSNSASIYSETYGNVPVEEVLYPVNASILAGLTVSISHLYLDFRYDVGLHSFFKKFRTAPGYEYEETYRQLGFKRKEQIISFSVGAYF